jgi:hypothetical protein
MSRHLRQSQSRNSVILLGQRDPRTNLWTLPLQAPIDPQHALPSNPTHQAHSAHQFAPSLEDNRHPLPFSSTHHANSAYHTSSQAELVQFLYAACGSPVPSTWMKVINNGHFANWPGLTAGLVRGHLPKSAATVKSHLNQQQQNTRSTKPKPPKPPLDNQPNSESPNERTHHVFAAVYDTTGEIATDQTGNFPPPQVEATNMCSSYTTTTVIPSLPQPCVIAPTPNTYERTTSCTNI